MLFSTWQPKACNGSVHCVRFSCRPTTFHSFVLYFLFSIKQKRKFLTSFLVSNLRFLSGQLTGQLTSCNLWSFIAHYPCSVIHVHYRISLCIFILQPVHWTHSLISLPNTLTFVCLRVSVPVRRPLFCDCSARMRATLCVNEVECHLWLVCTSCSG